MGQPNAENVRGHSREQACDLSPSPKPNSKEPGFGIVATLGFELDQDVHGERGR